METKPNFFSQTRNPGELLQFMAETCARANYILCISRAFGPSPGLDFDEVQGVFFSSAEAMGQLAEKASDIEVSWQDEQGNENRGYMNSIRPRFVDGSFVLEVGVEETYATLIFS